MKEIELAITMIETLEEVNLKGLKELLNDATAFPDSISSISGDGRVSYL